jgi:CDP-diglyceride synthetase
MTRRIRALGRFFAAFCLMFAFTATSAFAQTDGEGLLGETNDKQVTFISLGVLLFFVFVVTIGTIIQSALERRKDAKMAARMRQRTGW